MKCPAQKSLSLLIIEDSDEDFEALRRIINQVTPFPISIDRCLDGDDALDFLNQEGVYKNKNNITVPDLIILDLNLPGTDGREILVTIKQSRTLKIIPVVVLSTSANPQDIEDCYQSGVNSYMLKPMNISDLKDSVRTLLDYWLKAMVLPNSINF
jgi:CheY-like chemotaxis protein